MVQSLFFTSKVQIAWGHVDLVDVDAQVFSDLLNLPPNVTRGLHSKAQGTFVSLVSKLKSYSFAQFFMLNDYISNLDQIGLF